MPTPTPDRERSRATVLGGGISLEWRLPLLITVVLAVGLAATLALTYATLTRRTRDTVRRRLGDAVEEVAATAKAGIDQRVAALKEASAAPELVTALRADQARPGAAAATARPVLLRLAGRDTLLPTELWDAHGRRLLVVGQELAAPARPPAPAPADVPAGRPYLGPLQVAGDRARVWMVVPVLDDGVRAGYVAQLRQVGGARDVTASLRELIGEEVTLHMRNADGTTWTTARGTPAAAPARRDSTAEGITYARDGVGRLIAAEAEVRGTPWMLVLESPEQRIVDRERRTLRRLALLALVVTLGGAALSWIASRRITRPLATLTAAAEGVASGRYDAPVTGGGRDEIGRLASSFDAMARHVETARLELEQRVDDAQAAADGLALANWQLREAMAEAERARADAERARADAEHASRAKSDFLAVMSHELRTPLNAIGGYAQLLEMGTYGPVTAEQREALARVGRSQAHLLALINDVLNFARIDAGHLHYVVDDVPVHHTLAELEAIVAPQVQASRLTFAYRACDAALTARADRDKLRQVLVNLLSNAIKYTPAGGAVTVYCDADPAHVRVHVTDTGTGIPLDRLTRIFEPFVQGDRALNRPEEGVGLGLSISRELARGMGGELEVTSEVGVGSTFTVVLPRAGVATRAPEADGTGTSAALSAV